MKRYYIILILFAAAFALHAQPSAEHNYIITRTPLDEVADMDNPGNARVLTTVQYYDGLGRPSQSVQVGASPTGADLVGLTEYDGFGREYRQWLPAPVAGNGGAYVPGLTGTATTYYNDTKPYEETLLEQSPLNRTLGVKHPGYAFHNHPTGVEYGTNAAGEVKLMSSGYDGAGIQTNGYYAAGTLYKTTRTDEDGNVTHEYTDLLGQVVLTRQVSDGMNHDTYYVYDDFGNLVCVLPPLLADHVGGATGYLFDSDTWLKDYAYCYKYDYRNRCTQKRLPGCEWVYQVYDKADRLVLTQDGNQRAHDKWTSYKYDRLGRLVYTAEIVDTKPFSQLLSDFAGWLVVEEFSTQGHEHRQGDTGYSKSFYHLAETDLLTVNYYDNYDFLELLDNYTKGHMVYTAEDGYGEQYPNATGLLTGTRTYLLGDTSKYLATVYYYDNRGRVVQECSTTRAGDYWRTCHAYDFGGNVTKKQIEHRLRLARTYPDGQPKFYMISATEQYRYTYDHAGRLVDTYHKLNNHPEVLLSHNEHDETGRLITKKLHNSQNTASYEYNIRDWLTEIKDGDFKESLYYCGNGMFVLHGATNLFNGNVSAATYTSNGKSHTFNYTYDGLKRLTAAKRKAELQAVPVGGTLSRGGDAVSYNETFTYDKHGNIITLQRNTKAGEGLSVVRDPNTGKVTFVTVPAAHAIDRLSLEYDGNRLIAVTDEVDDEFLYDRKEYHDLNQEGVDFTYDANGNMTTDKDRGILAIGYNSLNLPEEIVFSTEGEAIANRYWANGEKYIMNEIAYEPSIIQEPIIRDSMEITPVNPGIIIPNNTIGGNLSKSDTTWQLATTSTEYYGNLLITTSGHVPRTSTYKLLTPEGYVDHKGDYYYYRRDHLGNVREVWKATDAGAQTVQRTRYYPSGLPWEYQAGDSASLQPYKFNSCEFIETHGYDVTDLGNRGVYHAINRFTSMDRFAEKYPWQSPYVHAGNNPVNFVDVNGDAIDLSGMTEEEKEEYMSGITSLRQNSDLFNTIYTSLENSEEIYFVTFGQTTINGETFVNGQFSTNSMGGGSIVFLSGETTQGSVLSEEFFHAYQYDNRRSYDMDKMNVEFEAKVFSTIVGLEFDGVGEFRGAEDFLSKIINGDYGDRQYFISPTTVISPSFVNDYINSANDYGEYNRKNNIGNDLYKKYTTIPPYSLQKAIIEAYK